MPPMATEQPTQTQLNQPYGEIYDLGYQHYTGPRLGRSRAIQALVLYSIKRGVGIKKKWTSKIIPTILYMAAFGPVFIIAGITAFFPTEEVIFGYQDLFGFVQFSLLIFAAALAPEMLCDDRRENVLTLYFSRAITRYDYLLGKIGGMGVLMGTIAFGPPLLLFLANTFLANDPIRSFRDNAGDLPRIVFAGLMIALYFSSIGLVVAAFTNRKGIASAIIVGLVIFLNIFSGALYSAIDSGVRDYIVLISPFALLAAINDWLFAGSSGERMVENSDLPPVLYVGAILAVTAIACAVMYRRYLAED
jgi:ABC-2 type transport system permease protein